jgi:hypothetical protein
MNMSDPYRNPFADAVTLPEIEFLVNVLGDWCREHGQHVVDAGHEASALLSAYRSGLRNIDELRVFLENSRSS